MEKLNQQSDPIKKSGYLLPWNEDAAQPCLIYIEDIVFIPIFTEAKDLEEHLNFTQYNHNVSIKMIVNTDEFLDSVQPCRVALNPRPTERGTTRFTEVMQNPQKETEEVQLKTIPVNIWDDFYEDGYVPEGEKQETYVYVEDSEMPHEERKKTLEVLLAKMNTLDLPGVKLELKYYDSKEKYPSLVGTEHAWCLFERWEIRIEGLTHQRLHTLLDELNEANLELDGTPFNIYSES